MNNLRFIYFMLLAIHYLTSVISNDLLYSDSQNGTF